VVKEVVFAVPGDLATPTGGYAYDRRMIAELPALGWQPQLLALGDGFPRPTAAVRAAAGASFAALAAGSPIVIDGLAFGVLPEAAEMLASAHRLVALVHHPLALETGLSAGDAAALVASERAALARAHRVVATSDATARLLASDYGVPADRLAVVRPGTDRVALRPHERANGMAMLAVGAVVPRKGYDVLVAALARLDDLAWHLTIVGDYERSPETARRLFVEIVRRDLSGRIDFAGAVAPEQLSAFYAAADLFVLASHFEGYGMAYTEAIAHGVPVVGTTGGAIPETVPRSAGMLLPPGDVDALAATLRLLIENSAARDLLAAGARAAAATFPSWAESAGLFVQVLDTLVLDTFA
jgi:glycosyltransferase involved in cell wall biosynthesis